MKKKRSHGPIAGAKTRNCQLCVLLKGGGKVSEKKGLEERSRRRGKEEPFELRRHSRKEDHTLAQKLKN